MLFSILDFRYFIKPAKSADNRHIGGFLLFFKLIKTIKATAFIFYIFECIARYNRQVFVYNRQVCFLNAELKNKTKR